MEKQRMFQFSIFFTMLFVKVNRNLECIAWQGRGSDGNPPYLPLSQLPRWMDWSDGWMNCMKCEIRFFVLGHFGTKWFDGLKMSPFLSAFFRGGQPSKGFDVVPWWISPQHWKRPVARVYQCSWVRILRKVVQ